MVTVNYSPTLKHFEDSDNVAFFNGNVVFLRIRRTEVSDLIETQMPVRCAGLSTMRVFDADVPLIRTDANTWRTLDRINIGHLLDIVVINNVPEHIGDRMAIAA